MIGHPHINFEIHRYPKVFFYKKVEKRIVCEDSLYYDQQVHQHRTREHVLEYVLKHHGTRVEALAEALTLTESAARRQLDHLRADGLIESRPVKQAAGRPFLSWYPTSKGAGEAPIAYADLFARILKSLGEEQIDKAVATRVAVSLAERHRDEIQENRSGEDRIEDVTNSLRSEGIMETWRAEADGFHLLNSCCPYPQAAQLSQLPCEADRQAISLLIGSAVKQIERIVDGAPMCEYLVQLQSEQEGITSKAIEGNV